MRQSERRLMTEQSEDIPKYEIFEEQYPMNSRIVHYFREQTAAEFLQYTLVPIAGGTTAGAFVGSIAGGPGGALVGGSIGFASGAIYSAYANYSAYKEWLILHKETSIFNEFETLHRNHPALQEFIDPITRTLALDPVRDSFGHIYDRSTVVALSKRKINGTTFDSLQEKDFSMDHVQRAPEVLAKMKAVYKVLLHRELETPMKFEVRKGLQALIEDLDKQVINYVTRETTKLTGQLRSGEISLKQFTLQMHELTERMNPQI